MVPLTHTNVSIELETTATVVKVLEFLNLIETFDFVVTTIHEVVLVHCLVSVLVDQLFSFPFDELVNEDLYVADQAFLGFKLVAIVPESCQITFSAQFV